MPLSPSPPTLIARSQAPTSFRPASPDNQAPGLSSESPISSSFSRPTINSLPPCPYVSPHPASPPQQLSPQPNPTSSTPHFTLLRSRYDAEVNAVDAESDAKISTEHARARAINTESAARVAAINTESKARVAAIALESQTGIYTTRNGCRVHLTIDVRPCHNKGGDELDQEAQARILGIEKEAEARIMAIRAESAARIAREDREGAVFCPCVRQGQNTRVEDASETVDEEWKGSSYRRKCSVDDGEENGDQDGIERTASPLHNLARGSYQGDGSWGVGGGGNSWDPPLGQTGESTGLHESIETNEWVRATAQHDQPVDIEKIARAAVLRAEAEKLKAKKWNKKY